MQVVSILKKMESKSIEKGRKPTSHHNAARKTSSNHYTDKVTTLPFYKAYLRVRKANKRESIREARPTFDYTMGLPSRVSSARLTRYSVRMLPEGHVCVGEVPT